MSYPLIIETLHDFGLITDDQHLDALAQYEKEEQEYAANQERYREAWEARHREKPWWQRARAWFSIDSWYRDWCREPPEVKYPPEWIR